MNEIDVDFSGVTLRVVGLPQEVADRLERDWAPFRVRRAARPWLRLEVELIDGDPPSGPFRPKRMSSDFSPGRAGFALPQGHAEVRATGEAWIRLLRGLGSTGYFAMQNFIRACLAWSLPARSAALLHAAGLAIDGDGFALVGPEGSGKSTWARIGEERGAHVVSDDLVLVECRTGGADLLGSPFHSTHKGAYRPGRWPLAAILFPRHGTPAAIENCDALRAGARLAANLPFIASAIGSDDRVAALVERLVSEVPCRELTCAPDPSFVDLLRKEASGRG